MNAISIAVNVYISTYGKLPREAVERELNDKISPPANTRNLLAQCEGSISHLRHALLLACYGKADREKAIQQAREELSGIDEATLGRLVFFTEGLVAKG